MHIHFPFRGKVSHFCYNILHDLSIPILIPQEEKIAALQGFADQLIRSRHYAAVEVAERRASVLAQWSKLKSAMGKWRSLLGHSQSLQHFKREADEATAWMGEKMQVACDDSYKDPTNLPVSTYFWVINHGKNFSISMYLYMHICKFCAQISQVH